LRLFSFGGYGLALAALALVVFGAIECPPSLLGCVISTQIGDVLMTEFCLCVGCDFNADRRGRAAARHLGQYVRPQQF